MTDRYPNPDTVVRSGSAPAPRAVTADPALPAWITPELIEETIRVWQPYYATRLTPVDAVTMIQSLGQLFDVLSRDKASI